VAQGRARDVPTEAFEFLPLRGSTRRISAELGRNVSKTDFKAREPELHTQLLAIQRVLQESDTSVIIIVSGVEGAGKGEVVNRLNAWLDARGMQTSAFWDETEEERERPRFWRTLPARGTIGIFFGSWYTRPIIDHVFGKIDAAEFDRELNRISELEQMLTDDGTLIVKFWFHLAQEDQQKSLRKDSGEGKKAWKLSPLAKKYAKHYQAFARVSERAIRVTDSGLCPWYIIEAADRNYRDLTFGGTLLETLQQRLAARASKAEVKVVQDERVPDTPEASLTVLDQVDLSAQLSDKQYDRELRRYQQRLNKLTWQACAKRRFTVAVFEGWDAAGKGGAIRRATASIDARLFRVMSIAAPTDEERAHHYLWRFWRQLPRGGYVTIYDRSWYGRVLVERVEKFAQQHECNGPIRRSTISKNSCASMVWYC
jgi:polyphosphate kinase 2 (PPK2 family)